MWIAENARARETRKTGNFRNFRKMRENARKCVREKWHENVQKSGTKSVREKWHENARKRENGISGICAFFSSHPSQNQKYKTRFCTFSGFCEFPDFPRKILTRVRREISAHENTNENTNRNLTQNISHTQLARQLERNIFSHARKSFRSRFAFSFLISRVRNFIPFSKHAPRFSRITW
jgi:hypothetical protein